jgi:microcystin-dependent protein
MGTPYVGEIRMFGGNFAPQGWALCNGQLMAIAENDTLFNLIGTTFGGDGQETFALPDLQSRVPMHSSNSFVLGQRGGVESVTLTANQIPIHAHNAVCNKEAGSTADPANQFWAANSNTGVPVYTATDPANSMNPGAMSTVGGSQPHDNMMPFLAINFIISLFGVFPSQS